MFLFSYRIIIIVLFKKENAQENENKKLFFPRFQLTFEIFFTAGITLTGVDKHRASDAINYGFFSFIYYQAK